MSSRQPDGHAAVHRLDDYRTVLPPAAAPPDDDVWAEIVAAAHLVEALRAAGLQVGFHVADATHPTRVRVTDLEGRVVRELSPSVACDPAALRAELLPDG